MRKLLLILLLLCPAHGAWADYDIDVNPGGRFKEGIFRGDPYVSGCIRNEYNKALICGRWRFHEGKVKGSWDYAMDRCYSDLYSAGSRKYGDFSSKINQIWSIDCNPG